VYSEYVGRESFYGFLAEHRDELFRDEDFAGLYCRDERPAKWAAEPACLAGGQQSATRQRALPRKKDPPGTCSGAWGLMNSLAATARSGAGLAAGSMLEGSVGRVANGFMSVLPPIVPTSWYLRRKERR
jgi:hypothetical protein